MNERAHRLGIVSPQPPGLDDEGNVEDFHICSLGLYVVLLKFR